MESDGPFSQVMGTFTVPSLSRGSPRADQMSVWVGIDGGNGDKSLIQAGFNESPDSASPSGFVIQPWWEILPASETYIDSVDIAAGDTVTVAIKQVSGTQWGITLTDNTNGQTFTTDQTYSGPASTAEWIVEALTVNGEVSTLAPYSPAVSFSDLGFVGSDTTLQEVLMMQGGVQVSTPSVLTSEWIRCRLRVVSARRALIGAAAESQPGALGTVYQPGWTASRCHSPGTPLRVCCPRSSKTMPDPTTRSRTVPVAAYLTWLGQGADPGCDVHGQPSDVVAA